MIKNIFAGHPAYKHTVFLTAVSRMTNVTSKRYVLILTNIANTFDNAVLTRPHTMVIGEIRIVTHNEKQQGYTHGGTFTRLLEERVSTLRINKSVS